MFNCDLEETTNEVVNWVGLKMSRTINHIHEVKANSKTGYFLGDGGTRSKSRLVHPPNKQK